MLASKDEPEDEKICIEDPLLDIIEQVHPRHLKAKGCILNGQVEEGEGSAKGHQHLLQQRGGPRNQAQAPPEPDHLDNDYWEEEGLEGDPHPCETSILVYRHQPDVSKSKHYEHHLCALKISQYLPNSVLMEIVSLSTVI